MRRYSRALVAALLPVAAAAGCKDWLNGPGLTTNPNNPTTASRDQLFVGSQATGFFTLTAGAARAASIFDQQMSGTERQFSSLSFYTFDPTFFADVWGPLYQNGGLIAWKRITESALADGDQVYAGIAHTWEALLIGTAADLWGDIPFSQAADSAFPVYDEQAQVYQSLQAVLDSALTELGSGAGSGPGALDLVYGGNPANWTALANTVKARLYMHMARASADSASLYAQALAAAQEGITDATGASDFTTVQGSAINESNQWYQFYVIQRSGYIAPAKFLIDLMNARNDPRRDDYFTPAAGGGYVGAPQGSGVSGQSELSDSRLAPDFNQPIVTYDENQLLIAEAAYRTGDQALALSAVNAYRDHVADEAGGPVQDPPASGPALLEYILTEKYIAGFQTIEAYIDYLRTCVPNIAPTGTNTFVVARLLYSSDEINTNPNTPPDPVGNESFPPLATTPTGATCLGQASRPAS